MEIVSRPGLRLVLWRAWLPTTSLCPRRLHDHLREAIPWRQPVIRVFGQRHPVPRLTCWVGDPGCSYRYSGLLERPHAFTPPLEDLRQLLEAHLGVRFNSLLLNRYRSGADRMGWHADDEAELDIRAPIASLSLGATRALRFRPRPRDPLADGEPPFAIDLADGDLLLMDPPSQRHWQHGLPQRLRLQGERLNLTFRLIQPS
jgi:alkylated DNA repair dioxygenase AlkB